MPTKQIQAAVSVNREPKEVIGFVSDIRNRLKYLQSLKSVSNVEGSPAEAT